MLMLQVERDIENMDEIEYEAKKNAIIAPKQQPELLRPPSVECVAHAKPPNRRPLSLLLGRKKSLRSMARERSQDRFVRGQREAAVATAAVAPNRVVGQLRRDRVVTRLGAHRKRYFFPVVSLPRLDEPGVDPASTLSRAAAVRHVVDNITVAVVRVL